MSWTILNDPKNPNDHLTRLETAIGKAHDKGALVFCSAPDVGALGALDLSRYYPFGCTSLSGKIFRIGAAKADGHMYSWAGDPRTVDFILPGHDIEYREDDKTSDMEENIPRTGSSVATALAAGLAALIIHCVRLGAIHNHRSATSGAIIDTNGVTEHSVQAIKHYKAMSHVFRRMIETPSTEGPRLDIQRLFKDPGEEISVDSGLSEAGKWQAVAKLARDLESMFRGI